MTSTRLPGKVLLPLAGKTVLENVVLRVRAAKNIKGAIVLTTDETSDDPIVELCREKKIKFFRGSINDVLDRYYQAAKKFKLKNICRITSDCPLVDPELIDRAAEKFKSGKYDYAAINRPIEKAEFPDGMDAEIFSWKTLKRAWQEAKFPSEREHVTPYIWKNSGKFKIFSLKSKRDLSKYRVTLDEPADYERIKTIYKKVRPLKMERIINFLNQHPKFDSKIMRDEGYYKSLKND